MPQQSPGGKVNAANLNVEGLNPVASPLGTDVLILGRPGVANQKVTVSQISTPDPLVIQAGTAGAPGLAFDGDLDTGIFSPGADEFGITAGGIEVARFIENIGVVQMVLPQINDATNPTLAFGAGANTGFFEQANGQLSTTIEGIRRNFWTLQGIFGNATGAWALADVTASATVPTVIANRNDLNSGVGARAIGAINLIANNLQCMEVAESGGNPQVGFYATTAIDLQTGVAVTAAAIHAALVALGLITA